MKYWLTVALLGMGSIVAAASAQTTPPTIVAQASASTVVASKDGPFRLLAVAKADARQRRAQGFRADVVLENGFWWVIYYP
jgi:hypothetical protein